MNDPQPPPALPKWLSRSVVVLLAVQVGLLWTHGSLLQRQHDDIQALREDVQALTDSLYDEQDQDGWDSSETSPKPHPARGSGRAGHQARRAAYLQADEGDPALKEAKKDLDATRQSEQEALAKARKVQQQLSPQANLEQAEAKARLEPPGEPWKRWAWIGTGLAVAALAVRSILRRR